ncbi:hypothetical protein BH23BAC1_BH23BAC1_27960 [soil metagenome]
MALKTKVYICGINNLSDARYCAGMGVELMGFNLIPESPEYITPDKFKEITGWISGVYIVGEFGNSTPEVIESIVNAIELDYIEVSDPKTLTPLKVFGIPLIFSLDISLYNHAQLEIILNTYQISVEYFILNASQPLEKGYWNKVMEYAQLYPLLIAVNVGPEGINELLDNTQLSGIVLNGGHENKPGLKDFDELASILEAIEIDDAPNS